MSNERYVRMNQLSFDLAEVEAIEWKKIDDDENISNKDLYSVRIHLKSGKMYSRQLFETQFGELKEQYKELIDRK
jgi:hypothetical protein|tara:strand:- start:172 stop:396 length:225 start_codon:yes stop_codon:yes gene_type:complete